MGYFYDWVDGKYLPIRHDRKLSAEQRQQIDRRRALLDSVIDEIAHDGAGEIGLYAHLLARALVKSDELLMRARGKQVVQLAHEIQHSHRPGH